MEDNISIYKCKDGRMRVYLKDSKKVISYPKYLMEQHLGRCLSDDEQVHHKDGNPLNNDIDNLEVISFEEHLKKHAEENRKYCDKTMVCPWCGNSFLWTAKQQQESYKNRNRNTNTSPFCSRSCAAKFGREVQLGRLTKNC